MRKFTGEKYKYSDEYIAFLVENQRMAEREQDIEDHLAKMQKIALEDDWDETTSDISEELEQKWDDGTSLTEEEHLAYQRISGEWNTGCILTGEDRLAYQRAMRQINPEEELEDDWEEGERPHRNFRNRPGAV